MYKMLQFGFVTCSLCFDSGYDFWQENHGEVTVHPIPCVLPGGAGLRFVPIAGNVHFFLQLGFSVLQPPQIHADLPIYPKDKLS